MQSEENAVSINSCEYWRNDVAQ